MSDSNSQYKHSAENIEYTETIIDSSTNESKVVTMSLAEKIRALNNALTNIKNGVSNSSNDEEPYVDFMYQKDTSTGVYGGKIKISNPNSTESGKSQISTTLNDFTNDAVAYIKNKLDM
jgi:hypothetical protein